MNSPQRRSAYRVDQEKTLCPLCRVAAKNWRDLQGYPIQQCDSCHHRFVAIRNVTQHVKQVYADVYFVGGGAGYQDYLSEGELLRKRGRQYAAKIANYCRSPGTILDVGAAAGFLLQGWVDAGWQGCGVEPNQSMVEAGIREHRLDLRCGQFETVDLYDLGQVDCVSMIQVISHFVDPMAAIQRAVSLLRPGGHLLIETWNRESLSARMFGSRWHEYSPPSVLHWFSTRSLTEAVERCGMQLVISRRAFRWINAQHAKSLLQHVARRSTLAQAAAMASRVIPDSWNLPYPGDDLFWSLFVKPST